MLSYFYRRGLARMVRLLFVLAAIGLPVVLLSYPRNPPTGYTGGFGEPNCTQCHSGTVNPAGGSVTIGAPASYTTGATVQIPVTIQDGASGRNVWGFELSARFKDGKQAGSFVAGSIVGIQTGLNGVQYAAQSPAQTQPGNSYTYTVAWTAPADAAAGDVTFNAAGMAADGRGSSGDHVFTTQTVAAAPVSATPKISAGGVVNAASFVAAPSNTGAPAALVSVFGTNLAATTAAAAIPLPTELGGINLLVNGTPAPLIYVSPAQINAQVPATLTAGQSVNVVVHRVSPAADSPAESFHIDSVSPGIFTVGSSGAGASAVLHQDNVTLVSSSAPAKPGEVVVIFCTGLGQTQAPALESGKAGAGQRTLEIPTLTIGGQNARVDFSGAAPGFVGLYQINAVVPVLAAGDHEIIISIAGKQSRPGATIRVAP